MAWAPDYITTAELKSALKIDDTEDDTELAFAITASSRAIDRAADRQFGIVASVEERYYEGEWKPYRRNDRWTIPVDDIETSTGLVVVNADGDTISSSDYELWPRNAVKKGRAFTHIVTDSVSDYYNITGLWGWSTVPDTIKQACLIQATRLFRRPKAPFGVAGSPELGSELRLLDKLDPDVEMLVRTYRRWWSAV